MLLAEYYYGHHNKENDKASEREISETLKVLIVEPLDRQRRRWEENIEEHLKE